LKYYATSIRIKFICDCPGFPVWLRLWLDKMLQTLLSGLFSLTGFGWQRALPVGSIENPFPESATACCDAPLCAARDCTECMKARFFVQNLLLVILFTMLGFVAMGYHPGAEDDGVYLAAVKHNVDPGLYPHDADFFQLQLQATVFDHWVGNTVRFSHLPIAWIELLWQLGAIFLALWSCYRIAASLFAERTAQWAGVAMVAGLFTLPVAGTALYLFDQHLHPRNVATALILLAASRILEGKRWQALPLLAIAFVMHPIMAAVGIPFCIFLALAFSNKVNAWLDGRSTAAASAATAALLPLGWMFEPPNPVWKKALDTRTYYYLYKWQWYEWLGALAPLVLFYLLWRWMERRGERKLARFALAVCVYGVFQQLVAMGMLGVPALIRLTPLQPMRYLQLVYFFLALIGGALAGQFLLKARVWRWILLFAVVYGSMFAAQRAQFESCAPLEMPWMRPSNAWLQAFDWIRQNTPRNALFAMEPRYMEAPGNNYHSFRALAERSQLADGIKDTAVVTQVPRLGPVWNEQVLAQEGISHFGLRDFELLHQRFGVDWVLLNTPAPAGLVCRWKRDGLTICQIP